MAYISADDIGAVAHRALTDEKPHNTDHVLLGRQAYTYNDVSCYLVLLCQCERKLSILTKNALCVSLFSLSATTIIA